MRLLNVCALVTTLVLELTILAPKVETISMGGALICARDYVIEGAKKKLISRSTIVSNFNERMQNVKERFDTAKKLGQLDGLDEQTKSDYYHKMVVEELRNLRETIDSDGVRENVNESEPGDQELTSCIDPNALHDAWSHQQASNDMDADGEEDDGVRDKGRKLYDKLTELQIQAAGEVEMGWSMTPEAREVLREKTRSVVLDLLKNEIRQIAIALLQAYINGSTLAPVIASLSGTLKLKMVDYFMNIVLDVISSILGKPVEIKPIVHTPIADTSDTATTTVTK